MQRSLGSLAGEEEARSPPPQKTLPQLSAFQVSNFAVPHQHQVQLTEQEAQLLQRDRVMIRVIEYFAKSLSVTQGYSI